MNYATGTLHTRLDYTGLDLTVISIERENRSSGGSSLEFSELIPGMDIEFWWPYAERNRTGNGLDSTIQTEPEVNECVGRFRPSRVVRGTVVGDEDDYEVASSSSSNVQADQAAAEQDRALLRKMFENELKTDSKIIENQNWEFLFHSAVEEVLEEEFNHVTNSRNKSVKVN